MIWFMVDTWNESAKELWNWDLIQTLKREGQKEPGTRLGIRWQVNNCSRFKQFYIISSSKDNVI